MTAVSEAAILSRVIEPDRSELPGQVAQMVLRWKFPEEDRRRMHELLEKAKAGKLTRREKDEAEKYERVGHLLSIIKSKARISLKSRNNVS
jgi:hypothetical protein